MSQASNKCPLKVAIFSKPVRRFGMRRAKVEVEAEAAKLAAKAAKVNEQESERQPSGRLATGASRGLAGRAAATIPR